MSEEWGPWIEHDGMGCPLPIGTIVHVVWDGWPKFGIPKHDDVRKVSGSRCWDIATPICVNGMFFVPISRYRIRKPKGLTILESVLREVEREKVTT